MPKATAKRLLFWCPFAGLIGYFFSATDAILDDPLIVLSVCVMMFEAAYLVFLSDKKSRPLKPVIFGTGAGILCISSLIATGASIISIILFGATALHSVWLWFSLKRSREPAETE